MRLLVLSPLVPDAPSDGDRLRLWHWLERLAPRHELSLLCFADPGRAGDWAPGGLLAGLARVERVPRPAWVRRLAAAGRLLAADLPSSVAAEAGGRLAARVDALLRERPFDAVLAYRLKMAPYALRFRGPRFLDYTDSLTRFAERLAVARLLEGRRLAAAWARLQARRLAAYEAWCAGQFDAGFFNAAQDRDAVAGMNPAAAGALVVAANGVDAAALARPRRLPQARDPFELLFVGNLAYGPNAEAVEWFARRVLPRVREREPRVHLTVAGGGAPRRLGALAALPGLRFSGFVTDVRPLLWRAAVGLCPLRSGAGRQNKLLEAFAAGLPSVATPLAARGAEAVPGRHLLEAGDEAGFAGAVSRLLERPALGRALARAARALALRRYGWAANAAGLEEVLLAGARRRAW